MALPMSDFLDLHLAVDDCEPEQLSAQALECFVHGLAHVMDELGIAGALEFAAGSLLAIAAEEAAD